MEARFEDKYPLTKDVVGDFRFWLKSMQGNQFRKAFPDRVVNTIYFDSLDMNSYVDNVEGTATRRKVRLRWYGKGLPPDTLRFEVKTRCNGTGTKRWFEIPGSHVPLEPYRSLARRLRRELPADLRTELDHCPVAVLSSRYHREYYTTEGGIRLTVDSEMTSRKLIGRRIVPPRAIPATVVAVVEVKYAIADVRRARRALATFPVGAAKNSKYARAVESWI